MSNRIALDALPLSLLCHRNIGLPAVREIRVVTENVGHLARFVTAKHWRDIP